MCCPALADVRRHPSLVNPSPTPLHLPPGLVSAAFTNLVPTTVIAAPSSSRSASPRPPSPQTPPPAATLVPFTPTPKTPKRFLNTEFSENAGGAWNYGASTSGDMGGINTDNKIYADHSIFGCEHNPQPLRGYLAHKKPPPPQDHPWVPRHRATVGSYGAEGSYERGTPVVICARTEQPRNTRGAAHPLLNAPHAVRQLPVAPPCET